MTIERALADAFPGTRLYVPMTVLDTDRSPVVEVADETSLQAARRMRGEAAAEVAVPNHASARNPGGGCLNGAQAQEEPLCRGSALHATLLRAPGSCAHHRAERGASTPAGSSTHLACRSSATAGADCWSPRVPPDPSPHPHPTPKSSAAGPRPGPSHTRRPGGPRRAGARGRPWLPAAGTGRVGYGVFMNDPAEVTDAFRVLLTGGGRFAGHFEQIVSGVPDRDPDSAVPAAFARAFGGQLQP